MVRREKKRRRPLESLRPDVVEAARVPEEDARWQSRSRSCATNRLNLYDERHAWVERWHEYVIVSDERGKNLTLLGAIRHAGWVVLIDDLRDRNRDRYVAWLRTKLLPKLRCGDVLVMDNLRAHHDARVVAACAARGVRVIYMPPHSPDFNPIEPAWALQKQHVRRVATLRQRTRADSSPRRKVFSVSTTFSFSPVIFILLLTPQPRHSGRSRNAGQSRPHHVCGAGRLVFGVGDLDAVAAVGLGAVHRRIGQAQQRALAPALDAARGQVVAVGRDAQRRA